MLAGHDALHTRASSAFRYGGNNILIEDCYSYGPCKYQFRGHFSREEKKARAEVSATARNNMLSFFTYFVTDDLPQRKAPGNIVIRNCKVNGADRLLHINLSGNEGWQRGNPPTDITFQNIEVSGIKTGLYAYGDGVVPYRLYLNNVQYSVAEGWETEPLIKAAHFGEINLQDAHAPGSITDDANFRDNSDGAIIRGSKNRKGIARGSRPNRRRGGQWKVN